MKYLIILINVFLCLACGNSPSKTQSDANSSFSDSQKMGACLLSYQSKMDELLPLDIIKIHFKGDLSKAEKKYNFNPEAKKHDKDTYEYTWDSDRTSYIKVLGRNIEMPKPNRIGIKWLGSDLFLISGKSSSLESFKSFYRNISTAEKEAAFKKANEEVKDKGYDSETVDAATNLGKELSSDEIIFKDIEGIGEAASWRIKDNELIVLVENFTFSIIAEISSNNDENLDLAKKLALEVLEKCK